MESPGDSPMPASPHTPSNVDDTILESMEGGGVTSASPASSRDIAVGTPTSDGTKACGSGFETPRSDADR